METVEFGYATAVNEPRHLHGRLSIAKHSNAAWLEIDNPLQAFKYTFLTWP